MRISLSYPILLSEISELSPEEDRTISNVCTDSRLLKPGDLFIAIKGKRYDGNEFVKYALELGAVVISDSEMSSIRIDTVDGFIINLIHAYKSKLRDLKKTVAITGSVGKTSTKTVLTKLLSRKFKVHSTYENQNNLLGTLYTVLSAPKDTEMLILEFGMNHKGEISSLSIATEPDVCLITNIGTAHIGNLGSREMIAEAKLEIEDGVKDGKVVVPADEPLLKSAKSAITLSLDKNTPADITFTRANDTDPNSGYVFSYCAKKYKIKISSYDKRLITSVANSLSVCSLLGLDPYEITGGDVLTDSFEFRQKLIEKNGYKIYDDTYSASFEATLCVVDTLICEHGKISCVLADMLELGDYSNAIHRKLGYELSGKNIDTLYLFGNYAKSVLEGLKNAKSNINVFINTNAAEPNITADQIKENYKGEVILVKGSRNMHTEKIIELLIK